MINIHRPIEEKNEDYSLDEDQGANNVNLDQSLASKTPQDKLKDVKFTLAISYNNGAIEYEHLGK